MTYTGPIPREVFIHLVMIASSAAFGPIYGSFERPNRNPRLT